MAIRLRRTKDAGLVALCAARSVPQEGDVYLDDEQHYALAEKFWLDYPTAGFTPQPETRQAIEREESHNANRESWDRLYACVRSINES